MKTYTAIYLAPTDVLEAWMSKSEAERKDDDTKMRAAWDAWMAAHASAFKGTHALGRTKSVGKDGIRDTKNGMMLYTVLEADSHEAAAAIFADHPHLTIPGATIEVMETRDM